MLKIEHLTKYYGEKLAVDDLSLHIRKGEIFGFIGHNGAGKTTTIKAICGIHRVEDGEIYIYPLYTWWLETELVGEDLVMTGGAPIIDGELRITETEGVYTVEFDFYDDMGNNIVGSISGEGDIYDESEPAASMTKAPAKTPIVLKKK